jgi:hypothetical protein
MSRSGSISPRSPAGALLPAMLALLLAGTACTKPPRPLHEDARQGSTTTPPPAEADGMRFVAVPPSVDPSDVPGPAPDANTTAVLADATSPDAPPPLSPEELFEIQYPLYGVVVSPFSPVYYKPDSSSPRLGYLRKGAAVRLGLKVDRGRGCVGGNWYPLPEKGFACSTSLQVDVEPPQVTDVPKAPDRDAVLPYRYGQNRYARTYALTRLPNAEELALVHLRRDELLRSDEAAQAVAMAAADGGLPDGGPPLVELDAGEPDGEAPPPDPNRKPVVAQQPEFEHVPGDELPVVPEPPLPAMTPDAGTSPPRSVDGGPPAPPDAADAGVREAEVVYSLAGPPPGTPGSAEDSIGGLVAQWLEKEFFISIDRSTAASGERFYRTIKGTYVPLQYVMDIDPPGYEGLIIAPDMPLPIGFVGQGRPTTYRRGAGGRALAESGRILRQAFRFLREKDKVGAIEYWVTTDGEYVRGHNFGIAEEQDPPAGVEPEGKWIQVDLSDQLLVAFQGRRPVFAALVSTGKDGFETPAGNYRILSKHVSATMDGVTEADGAYSIEDVPWTMFFSDNFALHGAFWHNRFGMTKSHGCVNMSPIDAKWIFEWSEPHVPEGWHGVISGAVQPGTVVIIHE